MVTLPDQAWPVPISRAGLSSDRFVTTAGLRGHVYRRAGTAVRAGRTAVAIGQFDGVHRGHQALLARARRAAPPEAAIGAVTFDRHPMSLLAPDRVPPVLTGLDDKIALLLDCGLDFVVVLALEPELLATDPDDFVDDLLVSTLDVTAVAVGANFRFGRGAAGDGELLRRLGPQAGFVVVVPELERYGGAAVSSTAVRTSIARGDVAVAAHLLGRPYQLRGSVLDLAPNGCRISLPADVAAPASGRFAGHLSALSDGRPTGAGAGVRVDVADRFLDVFRRWDVLPRLTPGDEVSLVLARRLGQRDRTVRREGETP